MLMCDFVDVFNEDSWAHYYIFIYSILLFCNLIFVAFLQNYPIPKFAVLIALHAAFLVYVVIKRPFKSRFDNFKSIIIQCILIALVALNLAMVGTTNYAYGLELAIMIMVCVVLVVNIGLYVTQVVYAY